MIDTARKMEIKKAFSALDGVERAFYVDYGTISGGDLTQHSSMEIWHEDAEPIYIDLSEALLRTAEPPVIAAHYAPAIKQRREMVKKAS